MKDSNRKAMFAKLHPRIQTITAKKHVSDNYKKFYKLTAKK